ncbi:MAG: hypothetical protein HY554_10185 [Elusimicrobia bacterium]|nr:hypothetical protein [Elusimicrobiota bacterium]
MTFSLALAAALACPSRAGSVRPVAARAPVAPVAINPFSPPFEPERRVLAAVAARYGTDPEPEPAARLGLGDWAEVRAGVLPARPPRALGRPLPARPGGAVAVKIPYEDPGGMMSHEARVSRRLTQAGGGALFVRAAYDPQLGVLVMERLRGHVSLGDWLESRRVTRAQADRIRAQLGRVLAALEASGLVHSDLKPEHVLVGPGARLKVIDFGIAAERGAYPPYPGFEGWRGGHVDYVSPNQLSNGPAAFEDDRHAVSVLLRRLDRAAAR